MSDLPLYMKVLLRHSFGGGAYVHGGCSYVVFRRPHCRDSFCQHGRLYRGTSLARRAHLPRTLLYM